MKKISGPLLTLALLCLLLPNSTVKANDHSAYDLIVAVNTLRSENGLKELPTNVYLMAAAQKQATFLANTYGSTPPNEADGHRGEDGSDATERAIQVGYEVRTGLQIRENWAAVNTSISLDTLLNDYWGDSEHMSLLLNEHAIEIGVGAAQVDNIVYYVLNIAVDYSISPTITTTIEKSTKTPGVVPVMVSTPRADGSVIHVVEKGQSLWSIAIAYGVNVVQLQSLNNLSANAIIYEGESLVIRPAYTATPSPIPTNTPLPPTRTPVPPQKPQALNTPIPEPPQENRSIFKSRYVGIGLIVICGGCLVYLIYSTLRKKG